MSVTESVTKDVSPAADVSTEVVTAVAATTNTPIEELPPLYGVIDTDALDALFAPRGDGRPRTGIHLTFSMAGCTVDVHDGRVTVTPEDEPADERPVPRAVSEH